MKDHYLSKFNLGADIPKWIPSNTHYLTITGSYSYGTNMSLSDCDIAGFCIPPRDYIFSQAAGYIDGFDNPPRFDEWQKHHVEYKDRNYDFKVFSIVKFFKLLSEGNPNSIDILYTDRDCIQLTTSIGELVRKNRRLFLSKRVVPRFRGYAYAELKNVHNKKTGQRKELVEKFGFDCYLEENTEFLTDFGWKKFDNIYDSHNLACVDIVSHNIKFSKILSRTDKIYSGDIYECDSQMNRFEVTENHNLLVSPAHRNPETNYSAEYFPDKSNWKLVPVKNLVDGMRSHYHILKYVNLDKQDYPIEDDYLILSGLFVSEGTINFRDGKVRGCRITQTKNGKKEFYEVADKLKYKKYTYHYKKESIWTFDKIIANRLLNDFKHGSKNKSLPQWTMLLSKRQAKLLWDNLVLGDGTYKSTGDVYYTTSKELADTIHSMMIATGHLCSMYGPYSNIDNFTNKELITYQLYLSNNKQYSNIKLRKNSKHGLKIKNVKNKRVVCFETEYGTLITRNNGRVSIQGNCKNACHVVRLLLECEQILATGDLNLRRDRELLKHIREGNWSLAEVQAYFDSKERYLLELEQKSTLPTAPDMVKVKQLLLDSLESHYGSLSSIIDRKDSSDEVLRQVYTLLENNKNSFLEKV